MVDKNGFRLNVGIVLSNHAGQLFWGRRLNPKNAWQFPQGGIHPKEALEQAMYRELYEEVGLSPNQVKILGQTQNWLHYYLPAHLQRPYQKPACIGQKQKWFLLQLMAQDEAICLTRSEKPEFDSWRWIDYEKPPQEVIHFKQELYENMLKELKPFLQKAS